VRSLRAVGADEWQEWRSLRRAALAEAPEAFWSTLEEWSGPGDTEERWRARLDTVACNLVADLDGRPVGMVSATVPDNGEVELLSLWVAPEARGRAVGDALIDAVTDWAREVSAGTVSLWVRVTNQPAIDLYARHGFADAGWATEPDADFPARKMVMDVRPAGG
jgi:ribosomal protein S18 acetylase RimI-like enzyme